MYFVVHTTYPHWWAYQDCHRCGCKHAIHLSCVDTTLIGVYGGYDKLLNQGWGTSRFLYDVRWAILVHVLGTFGACVVWSVSRP